MRTRIPAVAVLTALLFSLLGLPTARADSWDQARWDAFVATNNQRADHSLPALKLNVALNKVAQDCAVKVAEYYHANHALIHCDGHLGTIASLYTRIPAGWSHAGENISESGSPSGTDSVTQLMASPDHKENILGDYTHMGVGVAPVDGVYIFVHDYGKYATDLAPNITTSPSVLGDHDGDKVADLYGVDGSGNLLLSMGSTTGQASTPRVVAGGFGQVSYLGQIPDQTGDGRSDALVRTATDDLWLYADNGSGVLTASRQVGSHWGTMNQIVYAGTLSGSSTQYVVARRNDGTLFRYRLTTVLDQTTQIGVNWNGMRQIVNIGDMNGDGRADVLGIRFDGTLWLYSGTSTANIGLGVQTGHGWSSFVRAFTPGDMTGDGRWDLVGQRSDGQVFAYANLGTKGWGTARLVLTGAQGLRLMA